MSRPPARRPILSPALRRVWRDPHRLQLGTDPHHGVVLEFSDPGYARLLDLLDGTRTESALLRAASRQGIDPQTTTTILATLTSAGLLLDVHQLRPPSSPRATAEPTPRHLDHETAALALRGPGQGVAAAIRRRLGAHVLVTGSSRLAVPIAATLACAGIGHLDPRVVGVTSHTDIAPAGLLPADVHRPRLVAAAEAVQRAAPDVQLTPLRPGQATFVVVVGFTAPAELTALSLGQRRLAHLAVTVRDGTVVVGPLVRPGRTPCLHCLELHRRDRDPGWQRVAVQLYTAGESTELVAATTVLAGAAYAAAEVLSYIDGSQPVTLGATVEIAAPDRLTRRRWSQHPRCGCRRRPRSPHRSAPIGQP